jgi:rhamnosyltransferase
MYKVASIVVSYNGSDRILKTVKALLDQVDYIIIVDNNSDPTTKLMLCEMEGEYKVKVIYNSLNTGVACALNQGISHARARGFEWVLTMDQDSIADGNMVRELFEGVKIFSGNEKVVSFSPEIVYGSPVSTSVCNNNSQLKAKYEEKLVVITSGNLFKASVFESIGVFNEELFIDSVDFDFCLRLKQSGFHIIRCSKAILYHSLGEKKEFRFFGLKIYYITHATNRKYYIVRNHIYLLKKYILKYPAWCIWKQINMSGIILRSLILEDHKIDNARYIVRGFKDGIMNRYGNLR